MKMFVSVIFVGNGAQTALLVEEVMDNSGTILVLLLSIIMLCLYRVRRVMQERYANYVPVQVNPEPVIGDIAPVLGVTDMNVTVDVVPPPTVAPPPPPVVEELRVVPVTQSYDYNKFVCSSNGLTFVDLKSDRVKTTKEKADLCVKVNEKYKQKKRTEKRNEDRLKKWQPSNNTLPFSLTSFISGCIHISCVYDVLQSRDTRLLTKMTTMITAFSHIVANLTGVAQTALLLDKVVDVAMQVVSFSITAPVLLIDHMLELVYEMVDNKGSPRTTFHEIAQSMKKSFIDERLVIRVNGKEIRDLSDCESEEERDAWREAYKKEEEKVLKEEEETYAKKLKETPFCCIIGSKKLYSIEDCESEMERKIFLSDLKRHETEVFSLDYQPSADGLLEGEVRSNVKSSVGLAAVKLLKTIFGAFAANMVSADEGLGRYIMAFYQKMTWSSITYNLVLDFVYFAQAIVTNGYHAYTKGDWMKMFAMNEIDQFFLDVRDASITYQLISEDTQLSAAEKEEAVAKLKELSLRVNHIDFRVGQTRDLVVANRFVRAKKTLEDLLIAAKLVASTSKKNQRPYCVGILGSSGVGKSQVAEKIGDLIQYVDLKWFEEKHPCAPAKKPPCDASGRWVQPKQKHDNGYTGEQTIILMDEMGATKPEHADYNEGEQFLKWVNDVPTASNQAELSKKGNIIMKARGLICTSNLSDFGASKWLDNAAALIRRFDLIVEVEPLTRDPITNEPVFYKDAEGKPLNQLFSQQYRLRREKPTDSLKTTKSVVVPGENGTNWMRFDKFFRYLMEDYIRMRERSGAFDEANASVDVSAYVRGDFAIELPASLPPVRDIQFDSANVTQYGDMAGMSQQRRGRGKFKPSSDSSDVVHVNCDENAAAKAAQNLRNDGVPNPKVVPNVVLEEHWYGNFYRFEMDTGPQYVYAYDGISPYTYLYTDENGFYLNSHSHGYSALGSQYNRLAYAVLHYSFMEWFFLQMTWQLTTFAFWLVKKGMGEWLVKGTMATIESYTAGRDIQAFKNKLTQTYTNDYKILKILAGTTIVLTVIYQFWKMKGKERNSYEPSYSIRVAGRDIHIDDSKISKPHVYPRTVNSQRVPVPPKTASAVPYTATTPEAFLKTLRASVFNLAFTPLDGGKLTDCTGFAYSNRVVATCAHAFNGTSAVMSGQNVYGNSFTQRAVDKKTGGLDFVEYRVGIDTPNMSKYLPKEKPDIANLELYVFTRDGALMRLDHVRRESTNYTSSYDNAEFMYTCTTPFPSGISGSPVICLNPPTLIGMHVCVNSDDKRLGGAIFCPKPTYASLRELVSQHCETPKDSVINYIESRNLRVVEIDMSKRKGSPKSNLEPSILYQDIAKVIPEVTKYAVPPMRSRTVTTDDGEKCWIEPFLVQLQKYYEEPKIGVPETIANKAMEAILEHFSEHLTPRETGPLTLLQSIQRTYPYSPLNMNSSGGPNFPRKKKEWFYQDADNQWHPKPEFMEQVEKRWTEYNEGSYPTFTASIKDEIRSIDKISVGGERLFFASEVEFVLYMRRFLLPLIQLIIDNWKTTGVMIGINCASKSWEEAKTYLQEFENVFTFDVRGMDSSTDTIVLENVRDLLVLLCIAFLDYTGDEVHKLFQSLDWTICAKIFVHEVAILLPRGNTSGSPATTIVNSLVGLMMLVIAWILMGKDPRMFFKLVRFLLYGDDSVVTTKDKSFNFITVRDKLAKFGYVITSTQKDGSEYEFQDWKDVTFLKRSFVDIDTPHGRIVACPLEELSIGKMLSFVSKDPVIPIREQLCYNLIDAQRQYFMYGREKFDEMTEFFKKLVKKHDLPFQGRFGWKTFDELSQEYSEKTYHLGFA